MDVLSVAWSPDGRRLATGSRDGTAKLWDSRTGQELLTLHAHKHAVDANPVAWSPDGRRLVTGTDDDDMAKVWDAKTRTRQWDTPNRASLRSGCCLHETRGLWVINVVASGMPAAQVERLFIDCALRVQ
jgi:WD40 repeat protein